MSIHPMFSVFFDRGIGSAKRRNDKKNHELMRNN